MSAKRVLAIGLDPEYADFTGLPGLTPEVVRAYIDAQIEEMRALGYEVESCLVGAGDQARQRRGKRAPRAHVRLRGDRRRPQDAAGPLLLFERILNLVHELAPAAAGSPSTPSRRTPPKRPGAGSGRGR